MYFTDEETDTQRRLGICPRSHSHCVADQRQACALTLGCPSEQPGIVLKVWTTWSSLRIRIIRRAWDSAILTALQVILKQFSERKLGTPAPYHREAKETARGEGSGLPFFLWGVARAFWLSKERCFLSLLHLMSGRLGPAFPAHPGPLQGAGGWEERGALALALTLPSLLPSPTPFLSCLLLWPEEMGWVGGGPLSSHPLPKSGVPPPPTPGAGPGKKIVLQGKCLDPVPGTGTLRPPAKVPSPVTVSLSPTAFPAIVLERTATQLVPAPVPVPPVTLSCHSPEGLHLVTELPHPGVSSLAAGGRWAGCRTFCVSSLLTSSSSLSLRERPWLAEVSPQVRGRRI